MKEKNIKNLNEAFSRKKFVHNIVSTKIKKIIENCLLIVQCKYESNPIYLQNQNHWKIELLALCNSILEAKLKEHNTKDKRKELISDIFYCGYEVLSVDYLAKCVRRLNKIENTRIQVTNKFQSQLKNLVDNLIDLMAEENENKLKRYISKF